MAAPESPLQVKLFMAHLFVGDDVVVEAKEILQDEFGDIDYISPAFPFLQEDYYAPEMGRPIFRKFFSFRKLINPQDIAAVKLRTNEIEQELACHGRRRINIDAGYMDFGKVVLASMKYQNQKIYLSGGVYADMNLLYAKGKFKAMDWTFPDFKSASYSHVLLHIRAKYKAALRKSRKEN